MPFLVERIVGQPNVALFAQAAALPLTTLTAWELLFDRIGVKRGEGADRRSLLIVGGAGGVGSIAIQLARKLTGLTVIATASRPADPRRGCRSLGAHHVIDHSKPFAPQLKAAGFPSADIVLALDGHRRATPPDHRGHRLLRAASGVIDGMDSLKAFDTAQLWSKCVSLASRADVHPLDATALPT